MTFDVRPVGGGPAPWTPASRRAAEPQRGVARDDRVEVDPRLLPGEPPAEVLDAVAEAGRVLADLHDRGRELRFGRGEAGRLVVEVRDLDGQVLRRIPASEALAVALGETDLGDAAPEG
jgi:flagellar protein FlaG